MKKIRILINHLEVKAELNDSKTAKEIFKKLPIRGYVNLWGEEIYFSIPVKAKEENAVEEVEVGSLGYWPVGSALCIFFGRTPASISNKPRAASPVNLIGRVIDNVTVFKEVKQGQEIEVIKGE